MRSTFTSGDREPLDQQTIETHRERQADVRQLRCGRRGILVGRGQRDPHPGELQRLDVQQAIEQRTRTPLQVHTVDLIRAVRQAHDHALQGDAIEQPAACFRQFELQFVVLQPRHQLLQQPAAAGLAAEQAEHQERHQQHKQQRHGEQPGQDISKDTHGTFHRSAPRPKCRRQASSLSSLGNARSRRTRPIGEYQRTPTP